jgi:peptidoglycan/LPS O-acetylase OafA/YrhL
MDASHSRERMPALTSLRFFAALAIIFHHLRGHFLAPDFAPYVAFNMGVSFFFILSGFVLHYGFRTAIIEKGLSWSDFMIMRVGKIWPAHLIAMLFAISLWVFGPALPWFKAFVTKGMLLSSAFLVQSWYPDHRIYFSINSVAWTLSVEMFFYVCFPVLCLAVAKRSPLPILLGFVTPLICVPLLTPLFSGEQVPWLNEVFPPSRLPEFILGILACEFRLRLKPLGSTLGELLTLALAVGGCVYFWSVAIAIGDQTSFVTRSLLAPVFAATIVAFSFQQGLLANALSVRPVAYLGEISFATYLVHQPIINKLSGTKWFAEIGPVAGAVVLAAAIFIASALLYHLVEKRCAAFAKQYVYRHRSKPHRSSLDNFVDVSLDARAAEGGTLR